MIINKDLWKIFNQYTPLVLISGKYIDLRKKKIGIINKIINILLNKKRESKKTYIRACKN